MEVSHGSSSEPGADDTTNFAAGSDLAEKPNIEDVAVKPGLVEPSNTHGDHLHVDEPSQMLDGTENVKSREEIIRVDRVWDKRTRKFRYVKTAKVKDKQERFGKYVVTVARCISQQGVFAGDYIVEIRGKYPSHLLSEIFQGVSGISFSSPTTLKTTDLWYLYYALPQLVEMLKATAGSDKPDQVFILEVGALVKFTHEHFSEVLSLQLRRPDETDFDHLWSLFPPHTLVYGHDALKQQQVFRVRSSAYETTRERTPVYVIYVDYLDHDGTSFGLVPARLSIEPFDGSAAILKLDYFPFQLHPDHFHLRETLTERGKKILSLRGQHLQEYEGHAIDSDGEKFNSHGRVMVDHSTFNRVMPRNKISREVTTPIRPKDMTDEQKMMLRPMLYGFSLGDKIWGNFAVERLEPVRWDESIIDSLVLEPQRKEFIQSLVKTHGVDSEAGKFDDFVRHKGKGLIGLLAGPPGVGKTLSAEAVAEIAHRPLYSVTSGELGENSSSLQRKLTELMELAEAWNAVVLLDEADVFLSKRTDDNLLKNAVTSIFLRHLEYYQGILLLTTNRINSIDAAFQSRIHFVFNYDKLSEDGRYEIWQRFLAKAAEMPGLRRSLDEAQVRQLAQLDLNGRQIKNVMSIAQAVARERKEVLDLACVELAVSFSGGSW